MRRKEVFMKREELKQIIEGITDEQLKAILDLNGADINKTKGEYDALKSELDTAKETISTLTTEAETLKTNNANADEWKSKFETLQNDIAEKEKAAKEAAEKAEREANILNRYNSVCVDKDGNPLEWSHDAIKNAYLQKFTEALADETNTGKSDADIFHALTKDDAVAFKGITPQVNLKGGSILGSSTEDVQARSIMGLPTETK